jgi:transposase
MQITTICLALAESVFQVHGVGVGGAVVIRKRVSRAKIPEDYFRKLPLCLVGIEACPSAHRDRTLLRISSHQGQTPAIRW